MASFQSTIIWAEEWTTKIQEMLDEPNKFKDICRVEYTDDRVLHNPYLTDPTVETHTRQCPYCWKSVTITDDYITINTSAIVAVQIDRADLAQQTFLRQMELAEREGILLNERLEAAVYAAYGSMTSFDNTQIGGAAGNITVSATNIDDIIRAIKREIREANGEGLLERNGGFVVWRPADLEILEGFMQANGFVTADTALGKGVVQGINYMGLTHYSSNLLTAGHVIAGVKKLLHIGILKTTYGQIVIDENPSDSSGTYSAIGVVSRVDYAVKIWTNVLPVVFNITVA